jgi:hypothetical protein
MDSAIEGVGKSWFEEMLFLDSSARKFAHRGNDATVQ